MQVKSIAGLFKGEHSAILSTFIKLPFGIKVFVLSIFEWPFYTGFTVCLKNVESNVNPNPAKMFCPENVICFLHLLQISKCTTDKILPREQSDQGPYCLKKSYLKI